MPSIAPRCHELRIVDRDVAWRIVYRTDDDAVVIVEVFRKTTARTSKQFIEVCRKRLGDYDAA